MFFIDRIHLDLHNGDHQPQKRTKPAPEVIHITSEFDCEYLKSDIIHETTVCVFYYRWSWY